MSTDFEKRAFCPDCEAKFDADRKYCPEDGALLLTYDVVEFAGDDPLVGSVLDDRFRIEEPLSEGGMGKVYRGSQMGVDRDVAIKVVTAQMSDGDEQVRRFFREAQTLSNFTHPNIVNFIDFGQDAERRALYLVMELIEGCALDSLLEGVRLDVELAVEIVRQVCAALSDPHDYGFVHRDLKPANVMLLPLSDGSLQVKLVDFGIAGAVERGTKVTKTGEVVGTPEYMAPEQAEDSEVTPASDIYSVGSLVYHMLSGRPMFEADSDLNLIFKHLRDEPPKLSDLDHGDELPPELFELFPKLVAKHPAERPDSVLEVRREFIEIAGSTAFVLDPERPVEESLAKYLIPADGERDEESSDDGEPRRLHAEGSFESGEDRPGDSGAEEDAPFEERTQVGFGPTVSEGDGDGEGEEVDPGRETIPTAGASIDVGGEVPNPAAAARRESGEEGAGSDVATGETETGTEEAPEVEDAGIDEKPRMTAEIRSPSPPDDEPADGASEEAVAEGRDRVEEGSSWLVVAGIAIVSAAAGAGTAWYLGPEALPEWVTGAELKPGGPADEASASPVEESGAESAARDRERRAERAVDVSELEALVGGVSRLPVPLCREDRDSCPEWRPSVPTEATGATAPSADDEERDGGDESAQSTNEPDPRSAREGAGPSESEVTEETGREEEGPEESESGSGSQTGAHGREGAAGSSSGDESQTGADDREGASRSSSGADSNGTKSDDGAGSETGDGAEGEADDGAEGEADER